MAATNNIDFYNTGTFILKGANTYTGGTGLYGTAVQIGVDSVGTVGSITSSALGTGTVTFRVRCEPLLRQHHRPHDS